MHLFLDGLHFGCAGSNINDLQSMDQVVWIPIQWLRHVDFVLLVLGYTCSTEAFIEMFRHEQCLITDVPHLGPLQRTIVEVAIIDHAAVGEALCLMERAHHGTHNVQLTV